MTDSSGETSNHCSDLIVSNSINTINTTQGNNLHSIKPFTLDVKSDSIKASSIAPEDTKNTVWLTQFLFGFSMLLTFNV